MIRASVTNEEIVNFMSSGKNSARKTPRKPRQHRKNFMLDEATLEDLGTIQSALRATSMTEALKHAVRKYAKQVRFVSEDTGRQVHLVPAGGPSTVVDIPRKAL